MDASLASTLDGLSTALLAARLRAPASSAMFPAGHSASALAHAGLDTALPGRGHAERSTVDLSRAVDALGSAAVSPVLYGGFTGLAWVVEHLRGEGDEDSNAEIDAALLDYLTARPWRMTYDLIGGLVGYGVYALERLPNPSAVELLEAIVENLASTAQVHRHGISWRTRPSWWPPADRATALCRGFNLGLAHGVPGVIGLLGRVWRAGIARRKVMKLLDGAVAWLLAQELPASSPSVFAVAVLRGSTNVPARSAWCYGDPGVAASLLIAARATGERAWERAAIRIGARAAARPPETCGVFDAGLCHGAAGLAHIYNRLHVETGDERFERAARVWLERTLAMRRPGRGLGGYRSVVFSGADGREKIVASDSTFLTGTPGIALALAAFASKRGEGWAEWDRVLLLSDAPAGSRTSHKAP